MLTVDNRVSGDDAFFVMTGITDGELLHGVRYGRDRAITESLVMRSRSGTVRQIRSTHHLDHVQHRGLPPRDRQSLRGQPLGASDPEASEPEPPP